jgi:hypothetical protein
MRFARLCATLALAALAGCHRPAPSSTCSVPSAVSLAIENRADGVFGVDGERVGGAPLVKFDAMVRTSEGIDAESGKQWLRFHLRDGAARALHDFTASPEGRSIVVVVGGQAAAHHKIRQPVEGPDFQVSCCNQAACDRWMRRVSGPPTP